MENRIVRYGERGVVESIVLGIIEKSGTKQFLKAIRWSNSSKPEWIDDVQNTTWIVEIGLGQFGDPDLILVCRTREGNTYYLFVEAKVNRYVDSSLPNSGGMIRGFNSRINGQLSLKYRFCKALEVWDGDIYRIVEPPELFEAYKKALKDTMKMPRRLSKHSILRYVLKQNDFHQATIDNCYFVALTWDREPGPFKDTSLDPDLLPLFLSKAGINQWSVLKKNVGWIGYGVIHRELDLPADFQSTLKLMTPSIEPTRVPGFASSG